ncbi:MAG: iron-containing alcohol dehydrogenase [Gammaproteobacteria bacterium]|nr:iron-containing alcohol dehydrogenase [Gammaproteobacteria bacterium]
MYDFNYGRIPPLHFGAGKIARLPAIVSELGGKRVLLVTGKASLQASGMLRSIQDLLQDAGIEVHAITCPGEPTTTFVDDVCTQFRSQSVDVVIGIGGGSVIDAGKAISAMLPHENSIFDYLEGVGRGMAHSGIKKPYIAVPTTSGTGSEVTKNAVISEVGPAGYKKSLRHDNLIPDAVVVDGDLLVSCPRNVTFACGMDAFTQLLEPYLSPKVSKLTEAIAWSGFTAIAGHFPDVCEAGSNDTKARGAMAYGALLSGIALANDGVGIVHGLASPIGGFFPIPHGVVCATLVAPSVRANLAALRARAPKSPALEKMARLGALLSSHEHGKNDSSQDKQAFSGASDTVTATIFVGQIRDEHCDALVRILDKWTGDFHVPRLGEYGIDEQGLEKILDKAQNRNNPIELTRHEIRAMLKERL